MKITGPPSPSILREPAQDRPGYARGAEGTAGFGEPGVFGLKREPSGLPMVDGRTPRCPAPAPSAAPVPGKVSPRPPLIMTGPPPPGSAPHPGAPRHAGGLVKTDDAGGPFHPDPEVWQPEPVIIPAGEPLEPGPLNGAAPGGAPEGAGPPAGAAEPAAPAPDLRVFVRDGEISISVKAPPLDAEGRNLLRRLVRHILAERRLALSDFQLNGVPLSADFQDMTGDSNGPRAR